MTVNLRFFIFRACLSAVLGRHGLVWRVRQSISPQISNHLATHIVFLCYDITWHQTTSLPFTSHMTINWTVTLELLLELHSSLSWLHCSLIQSCHSLAPVGGSTLLCQSSCQELAHSFSSHSCALLLYCTSYDLLILYADSAPNLTNIR